MRFVLLLIFVTLMVGCGGNGGGGGQDPAPNTFAGDWVGTWNTATQNGTAAVTIQPDGEITGTVENLTSDLSGTIEGVITDDGLLEATLQYEGGSPIEGSGQFEMSGDENTMTGTIGNGAGAASYTLNRVP